MAFGFYSAYNVQAAQVPSTQTDFPVLVNITDARFKTVGNGGHVQNSSGFDIRPYTNSGLGTAITGYELERFNASTGEVIMWVKVSSLSSSTTPFVLAYGDSGISTDGSSATTWSNSFVGVYHLADGTTLNKNDSANGHNLTDHNTVTATTGQIDGAAGFVSASTQHLDNASGNNPGGPFTLSAWVKATSFPNAYNTPIGMKSTGTFKALFVKSNGKLACYVSTGAGSASYDGTGSHTLSSATWYLLHFTYDLAPGAVGYVNGASDGTGLPNGVANATDTIDLGNDPGNAGRLWNGSLDECRTAGVVRSANWIATEYNNQSAPGTFATLGTEQSVSGVNSNFLAFM